MCDIFIVTQFLMLQLYYFITLLKFYILDKSYFVLLGAAPQSISERSTQSKAHKQSYFYSPQIGEVPALDVPLDLPDLPGIANDLHYNNDISSSIAPSADITPSILELDLQTSRNLPNIPLDEDNEDVQNISIAELPPVTEIHHIDLSSPPKEIKNTENERPAEIKVEVKEEPRKTVEKVPENVPLVAPVDDLRSSLMEAIRNAGGSGKAKLRSANENKENAKVSQVNLCHVQVDYI